MHFCSSGSEKKKNTRGILFLKVGSFTFGRKTSCTDLLQLINCQDFGEEEKANFREVTTALKSRPMRRLRGFSKRRFGTAPTILGTHAKRHQVEDTPNTVSLVDSIEQIEDDQQTQDRSLHVFKAGEIVVLRGSDGYPFNALLLVRDYEMETMHPNTKLKGNFLVPQEENQQEDLVTLAQLPEWEGGSQPFRDAIKDANDNLVTLQMRLIVSEDKILRYVLEKDVFQRISTIAEDFERRLEEEATEPEQDEQEEEFDEEDVEGETIEGENVEERENEAQEDENLEEQQRPLTRRERKGRGNNYASIIASLL